MRMRKVSRRRFIFAGLVLSPFAAVADARWIEPDWLKVRRLRLTEEKPTCRFVHFTDLHHKGDRAHTQSVVKLINSLSPEFVCFTGDLIEEAKFLPEALEILSGIKSPIYGVPGNHDYWSRAPFDGIIKSFAGGGGAWLVDEQQAIANSKINIIGMARIGPSHATPRPRAGYFNLLLVHYPAWVKLLGESRFDLILAGHSHGGQVRIPFYGPVMVPFAVDEFDLGFFLTKAGPMYVGAGIGWFPVPIRFNCRPEVTVIEI